MMEGFFTDSEIIDISAALKDVTGAGIDVKSYTSADPQKRAFYDKAKLWRVIDRVVSACYIQRLAEGKMFLHDKKGDEYRVVKVGG